MKKFASALLLAVGIGATSIAGAGAYFTVPVYVGSNIAYGSVKAARYSANTRENIGCNVYGATNQGGATTYVSCVATSANGASWSCSTYAPAPQLVQAALAISDSSYVIAQSDANYNCTYIFVGNNSGYI